MGKIVAIGGGELAQCQTLPIDRRIVALTGKRRPTALFIPTASNDSQRYCDTFRKAYGRLGCRCDVLLLVGRDVPRAETRRKIDWADLIYVGGGNSWRMLRRWRELGVDAELTRAFAAGKVLSGISAGANCWFQHGHSNSMSAYQSSGWRYIAVTGLGLVRGICCPHLHGEKRWDSLEEMVRRRFPFGLALDDCCAIEIIGDAYRVLSVRRGARAFRFFRHGGKVVAEEVPARKEFRPLAELYATRKTAAKRRGAAVPAAEKTPKPAAYTVRKARPADVDGIQHIEHSSFANPGEIFHTRQIRGLVTNPRAVTLVAATECCKVLGWAAGLCRRTAGGVSGRIYALAVHPDGRGGGIGRRITVRLIQALRRQGAGRIYLEVRHDNHGAIALYRKLGFQDSAALPHYYGHRLHGLRMVLEAGQG